MVARCVERKRQLEARGCSDRIYKDNSRMIDDLSKLGDRFRIVPSGGICFPPNIGSIERVSLVCDLSGGINE